MKTTIVIGQKFGKWTVVDSIPIYTKGGQRNVKVKCDCGTIEYKHWSSLRLGKTTQCMKCKRLARRAVINVGDKYKEYTVISDATQIKNVLKYKVRCSCGSEHYMTSAGLLSTARWFKCKKCATKESQDIVTMKNGKIGDLSLAMINRIKVKAILRNIAFDISIDYLWKLFIDQNKCCAITGDLLSTIKEASLDRIDSSLGYIEGNVQWTTKQANKCKHILTMNELYEFANKVISHANQQPTQPLTKLEGSETNG